MSSKLARCLAFDSLFVFLKFSESDDLFNHNRTLSINRTTIGWMRTTYFS